MWSRGCTPAPKPRCAPFTDSETFERMWEPENRLVDDFVRGELAPADRARFETHYLASPVHRQRVATARNLLAAAEESAPSREHATAPRISLTR